MTNSREFCCCFWWRLWFTMNRKFLFFLRICTVLNVEILGTFPLFHYNCSGCNARTIIDLCKQNARLNSIKHAHGNICSKRNEVLITLLVLSSLKSNLCNIPNTQFHRFYHFNVAWFSQKAFILSMWINRAIVVVCHPILLCCSQLSIWGENPSAIATE